MQLTIRVPEEYMRKIEDLAQQMGLKKSDITRLAIKEFITRHSASDESYPYQKAKNFLGIAESGISDLGQNHREHLARRIKRSGSKGES